MSWRLQAVPEGDNSTLLMLSVRFGTLVEETAYLGLIGRDPSVLPVYTGEFPTRALVNDSGEDRLGFLPNDACRARS